uniref:50S ribosomal protein L35 n=1 Tax=Chlamydomonas leiostraca TaxID=1034604 RepID=A0A7S0R2J6_9CHLO
MQAAVRGASLRGAFKASTVAPVRSVVMAPARTMTVEVQAGNGKLKTRKAAAKRFKVTGNGKVMARHCGKQHFNEKKNRDLIRENSKMYVISPADIKNATKCLPNSGVGH